MADYPTEQAIKRRYELLRPILDERLRRLWAAAESVALGTSGVAILSKATGLSRSTIRAGAKQLKELNIGGAGLTRTGRVRKPGGGRRRATEKDSELVRDLERLMEGCQANEPGPLLWTCKSLRKLAEELGAEGHLVSYRTVGNILHRLGYSFGRSGDYRKYSLNERHESFRRIATTATAFLERAEPVLSIRLPLHSGAEAVSHLMAAGLLSWWWQSGQQRYPRAQRMLLTVESATSGGAWTGPLEVFAAAVCLEVTVACFPPGAWRWRKSDRQVTCTCSLLRDSEGTTEICVGLDLVLSGVEPS